MGVPLRGVGVPSVGTGMASTGGPERQNTEQCGHSNSALSCGPRKAVEESRVYSAHMFCFKPGGRGHTSTCREKAEDRYIHACTCICTWRSEKHKLNGRGPYPGGFYGPSEVKSRQVLERPPAHTSLPPHNRHLTLRCASSSKAVRRLYSHRPTLPYLQFQSEKRRSDSKSFFFAFFFIVGMLKLM